MSKMSNIDYSIQNIKNWLKENKYNIVVAILVVIIGTMIHIVSRMEEEQIKAKEDRLNNIETRLQVQMNYIHQLEADVDNLYRVVE